MYRSIQISNTLRINEQATRLRSAGRCIYHFGFGQSPFPVPELVTQSLRQRTGEKYYSAIDGITPLREHVAVFHSQLEQRSIEPQQIMVTPGSKMALFLILKAFEKATILIPAPAWTSYEPQAQLVGHKVIRIDADFDSQYQITPMSLKQAFKRAETISGEKIVIINSPGNPDGQTYSQQQLAALAKVLKRHNAWCISDEIYGPLIHSGLHNSIAKIYPDKTFVTSGLSKWLGAGGWRLGILILPRHHDKRLKHCMLGIASELYSCASVPIQYAGITAYQFSSEIAVHLDKQKRVLEHVAQQIYHAITAIGLRAHPSRGGFYILVDFSAYTEALAAIGIIHDHALCETILLQTGVALLQGSSFGVASTKLLARLAFVDFDGVAALQNLESVNLKTQSGQHYCQHMLTGIYRLGQWLNQLL